MAMSAMSAISALIVSLLIQNFETLSMFNMTIPHRNKQKTGKGIMVTFK